MKLHLPVFLRKSLFSCFALVAGCTLSSGTLAFADDLVLGVEDTLTIDYASADSIPDLENGTLLLEGDTLLQLLNCGLGDGKTYELFTGVTRLVDAAGNTITLDSSNNAISNYFDTTQPGTGFWADATLQLSADGILRLVRHSEAVKAAVTISTRQTGSVDYQYYEGVHFADIEYTANSNSSAAYGSAIYGDWKSTITLSGNGSVTFSGNTASSSSSTVFGGAIFGDYYSTITLSNNGSVSFSGNMASSYSSSAYGSAIYGYSSSTITLSDNGSVTFSGNTASSSSSIDYSSAEGGAICGGTITLSNNGSVVFEGNTASSTYSSAEGGAIYGYTITLSNNGSVVFEGNTASSTYSYSSAYGGAIYGYEGSTITLSDNGSVTFSGNTASGRYAYGGAIYGYRYSTITLSDNGSVSFSGNTASSSSDSSACGGAIFGVTITLSNNESVTFSGNTASSRSACGGAIYGDNGSTITLSDNGSVSFSGNTAESGSNDVYGGAIYGASSSTITLSDNESVTFSGNTASSSSSSYNPACGGAIFGYRDSTITLSDNGIVTFSGNTAYSSASSAYGGAIFGYDGSTITLSDNGSVSFSGNTAASYSSAYGGAIYGNNGSTIMLSNNGSVVFEGNTASSPNSSANGGAIYGGDDSTITLSDNGSVEFSGNEAGSAGGAIYGELNGITLDGNGCVMFADNVACAEGGAIAYHDGLSIKENEIVLFVDNAAGWAGGAIASYYGDFLLSNNGNVLFSGNLASGSYARGGAIYGNYDGTISLSGNGSVEFSGNSVSSEANGYGGAIYGGYAGCISLDDNINVIFSGNLASGSSAYGGAIYTYGDLSIRNNDSVEFYQNAEVNGNTYRLRSIYAYGGSGDEIEISLSAAAGKSITFYDSVYIGSGATVNLNQDYTYQAEDGSSVSIRQQGDIVFTGKYTEQHLNDLLEAAGAGRTATAQEILNSRTTVVNAMTNLYGGRLRVEDGAIYKGYGITAMEGAAATVRVQNAELLHNGYDLTFNAGNTLELVGTNSISGNLNLMQDSTLAVEISRFGETNTLSGALTIEDGVKLAIRAKVEGLDSAANGTIQKLVLLSTTDADSQIGEWDITNFSLTTSGSWGYKEGVTWEDGKLSVLLKYADTVTWNNAAGDFKWNGVSQNWSDGEYKYTGVNGANVILGSTGAGTLELDGEVQLKSLTVTDSSAYGLEYAAGASLSMTGALKVDEGSSLLLGGSVSTDSVQNAGALQVAGDLMTASSIEGDGTMHVDGSLSAFSLHAASLSAGGDVMLTGADADSVVSGNLIADSVKLASGASLTVDGTLTADEICFSGTAETLNVGSLGTDSMNFVLDYAAMESLRKAAGESAAILRSENNLALGFTATLNGSTDPVLSGEVIVYSVSVSNREVLLSSDYVYNGMQVWYRGDWVGKTEWTDIYYIAGFDTINGVETVDLKGQDLVTSELYVDGDGSESVSKLLNGAITVDLVDIAGRQIQLGAGATLTADELYGEGETLVVESGAALNTPDLTIGTLSLDGTATLKKATMNALLSTGGTLAIETGGIVTVKRAVDSGLAIAGEGATLKVSGGLTAASLQIKSLSATALNLTDADASNSIGNGLTLSGAATVAGSLTVNGALAAASVSTGGELSATSLQTNSLSAGALSLTDSAAANTVKGDAIVAGAANVAGSLEVAGTLSAASLRTSGLFAESLNLTDADAANIIGSSVSMAGAANVAGSLAVDGALQAASLQTAGLAADSLILTDADASNIIGGSVSMTGAASVAGALEVAGALAASEVNVGGGLKAASLQTDKLIAESLNLTDADAANIIGSSVSMAGAANVAGSLAVDGALQAASLQTAGLAADSLILTDADASNIIGGSVSMTGAASVAGALEVAGALAASEVNVGGGLKAASLQTSSLIAESLNLTDAAAASSIGSGVSMSGAVTVAGSLSVNGALAADTVSVGQQMRAASLQTSSLAVSSLELTDATATSTVDSSVAMSGAANVAGALEINGSLSAASLQTAGLKATSLTLTDTDAASLIGSSVAFDGVVNVAGALSVHGALSAATLQTGSLLTSDELLLTGSNGTNVVQGDMSVASVCLASGASLTVGGTLTAAEVVFSGAATTLNVGSLGADSMNFVLDIEALRNLNLSYNETYDIAKAGNVLCEDFAATINGSTNPVIIGVYSYSVSANGSSVQLTAGSAFEGKQLWYQGAWMGESSWTDYYIAGFDALDGVETVNLNAATVSGSTLYVSGEAEACTQVLNGTLDFAALELQGTRLELGSGTTANISDVNAAGEMLTVQNGATLNVSDELTVDTLVLDGTAALKYAEINVITGKKGTLSIASGGEVSVASDVVLAGFNNEGSLNLGEYNLTVDAYVGQGGNVTAGDVSVKCQGSKKATFDALVADKVTVSNMMSASTRTDDLSVGNGSVIGELLAEKLEVRDGTVTLGRTSGSTEISLLNLDLQEDATLVLNQQTTLEVTKELTATENATVQLKKNATIGNGEISVGNKKDTTLSVNANDVAAADYSAYSELHIAVNRSADSTVDFQLNNSSIENKGSGTLTVTHELNLLSGVHASGGDVSLLNLAAATSLDVLEIAAGKTVSAYVGSNTDPATATQSNVTVSGTALLGGASTLNASLTLAAGSTLDIDAVDGGAVTINGALTFDSMVALGENLLAAVEGLTCWDPGMVLFTGLTDLTLPVAVVGLESSRVLANSVFSNVQSESLYVEYRVEDNVGSLLVLNVPEPATSTLSLLALAALAARRRRK